MPVHQFRDPRAEREPLENYRKDTLASIERRLNWIEEDKDQVPRELTYLRDVSRKYFDVLSLSYSLGASPEELREFVGPAVHWFVQHEPAFYHQWVDVGEPTVPWNETPIRVIDTAQLLSVVVLLGTAKQRAEIGEVIGLRGRDTALEFLAGLHGDSLDGVEVELSQPRPYARLIKTIQATPEQRPKLMAEFVKHWYNGCRKAYWWGEHLRGPKYGKPIVYNGYWCFEAAAVTKLLNIDDTTYRDNDYYPQDIFPTKE